MARFLKACNKANEQYELKRSGNGISSNQASVFIRSGYEQVRVELSDILYAESSGNYVQFILNEGKIISRLTMNEAAALLPVTDFIRVHRSYIVSKKYVSKIEKNSIWIGQTEIPVGASYINEVAKITG